MKINFNDIKLKELFEGRDKDFLKKIYDDVKDLEKKKTASGSQKTLK